MGNFIKAFNGRANFPNAPDPYQLLVKSRWRPQPWEKCRSLFDCALIKLS